MDRRALLRLFGGGALASQVVSVKDVVKAVEGGNVPSPTPPVEDFDLGAGNGSADSAMHKAKHAVLRQMNMRKHCEMDVMQRGLPTKIATKKSWSPAFKAHVAVEDELLMRAMKNAEVDWVQLAERLGIDVLREGFLSW